MKLKSKFAVVTGASTGIGREISIAIAKERALIALVARSKDRLLETKTLIEKAGGEPKFFRLILAGPTLSINS